ncbi:MAG: purine-nucleoside phosphorylase [Beijerinckiaceae bacterium]|nr:purine-nucleoside phosphorylase [Beijerinckiaceae bacterium]
MSQAKAAAGFLRHRGIGEPVELAVVLGTGLGPIAETPDGPFVISYQELPGFPQTTIAGHAGRLAAGVQEGLRVAYLEGRAHYYEGGNAGAMITALETMALLGAEIVLVTAIARSLRHGLYPGNIALITDHINLSGIDSLGRAPLDGRCLDLADAYDPRLRQRLKKASAMAGVGLQEAVYMWIPGPSFETPAEVKAACHLGANVIGKSLVPEVIIARHLGLRAAALTAITNFAAGFSGGSPGRGETQSGALAGTIGLKRLIRNFLRTRDEN